MTAITNGNTGHAIRQKELTKSTEGMFVAEKVLAGDVRKLAIMDILKNWNKNYLGKMQGYE